MFDTPYQTTACSKNKLEATVSELNMARMDGYICNASNVVDQPDFITAGIGVLDPRGRKVDAFNHPLSSREFAGREMQFQTIIDGRSFMTLDRGVQSGWRVNNTAQAAFHIRRAALTQHWIMNPGIRQEYLRLGDIVPTTYISWISRSIASKMSLDPEAERSVQIVTALFYIHQHVEADKAIDATGKSRAASLIQRWTRHPMDLIEGVVETEIYMSDIKSYLACMSEVMVGHSRIKELTPGTIVAFLGNSWFGFGAADHVAVALEYPPQFVCMVEAGIATRAWKETIIGKVAKRLVRGGNDKALSRSIDTLLNN